MKFSSLACISFFTIASICAMESEDRGKVDYNKHTIGNVTSEFFEQNHFGKGKRYIIAKTTNLKTQTISWQGEASPLPPIGIWGVSKTEKLSEETIIVLYKQLKADLEKQNNKK